MRRSMFIAVLLFASAFTLPTQAAQRTFVSTTGSDANTASNCANSSPCRGFAAALTVTDSGGEIIALSSGGYGPVTINKSVSIISPEGVYAGISVTTPSTHGVTIATADAKVVLRGLTINALAASNHGIHMTAGSSLSVENCVVSGFSSGGYAGLMVTAAATVRVIDSKFFGNHDGAHFTGNVTATVTNSRFLNNLDDGIATEGYSGEALFIIIERTISSNNNWGIYILADFLSHVHLDVKDSVITDNSGQGFYASTLDGTVTASVSNSLVAGQLNGIWSTGAGATVLVSGNTVTRNGTGLRASDSGVLESTGDNAVRNNTTNVTGAVTIGKL